MLVRKQVHVPLLDQSIAPNDATGRLLFHMLGAIAQFETELRAERQREGMQKARERGVHVGRQKKLTAAQVRERRHRRAQGILIKPLMHAYRLSKVSVYRYLRVPPASCATLV
jgi:DNA invertase Pin-like site-specific DNA recombinase